MDSVKNSFIKGIKTEFSKLNAKPDQSGFLAYKTAESDKYNKMATENTSENMKNNKKTPKSNVLKNSDNVKKMGKPIGKIASLGKKENKEAASTSGTGGYVTKFLSTGDEYINKSESETPKKVEANEAGTSSNVGSYSQPSIWAPSAKKWGPRKKTQIPGGTFVKVKKKCKTFPYCNQGDINALILSKNESLKEAIKNVAKRLNLNPNLITNILREEFNKFKKRTK